MRNESSPLVYVFDTRTLRMSLSYGYLEGISVQKIVQIFIKPHNVYKSDDQIGRLILK